MRTLVTGATGYVGSRLVTALLGAGHQVCATSRKPHRLADFGWYPRITPVALDAHDEASVATALAEAGSVDVVYYLLHGIGQDDFREADNRAAATVAAAAKDAGVGRIVYLGGFVPEDIASGNLSEHLTGRAEVAHALHVDGGADVVWLGAAMIIGAGSTSFEMLRYVGDRFLFLPLPEWSVNPIDPISISDVLYYLVVAADTDQVPAGAYDIYGPETTSYGDLLRSYARIAGKWRAALPIRGVDTAVVSRMSAAMLPVPDGLAADLVESLDFPMTGAYGLRDEVPDPPGGLVSVGDAIARSLSNRRALPIDELADPHHLATTDPPWAGGDTLRIRRLARTLTPPIAYPALGVIDAVPGPVAGALRTGLDRFLQLAPRVLPT